MEVEIPDEESLHDSTSIEVESRNHDSEDSVESIENHNADIRLQQMYRWKYVRFPSDIQA